MTPDELKTRQTPFKNQYRDQPESALATMRVEGTLGLDRVVCHVKSEHGEVTAGLHARAGGSGDGVCAGDMLLEALIGCAGVTLAAVATAMSLPLRGGKIIAEGDLDFRGTLGVSRDAPVGFKEIRLKFALDTDATSEQVEKLIQLTERYCVVYQTLKNSPSLVSQRV